MAIFGYSTAGATQEAFRNKITGSRFTITENGVANSISAYIEFDVSGDNTKCAIYQYSNLALIGITEQKTAVDGWNTFNISGTVNLTSGTEYILVVWTSQLVEYILYDSGTTNQGQIDNQGYGTFPDPLVPISTNNNKYSIYCTYTPSILSLTDNSNVIFYTYAPTTDNTNVTYKISVLKSYFRNIIYRIGTYGATPINKISNISFKVLPKSKNIYVYPYDMTRDHSLAYLSYISSWTLSNEHLDGYLGFSDYPTFGYGYSDIKTSTQINFRVGGKEAVRYKFYVDTAMQCERLYLQAGVRSSTARPSDNLNFKLFKGSTVVSSGQFVQSARATIIDYGVLAKNVPWSSTPLIYSFGVGNYTIGLYSTSSFNNKHYHMHVLNVLQSRTSFQGATASYSYSSSSGLSWSADQQTYDLPFMLGVRAYSATVMASNRVQLSYATIYAKSTSYPTYNKFVISDHSGYVEMPLKNESYNITVRKNNFDFIDLYKSFDGKVSTNFNFPSTYSYSTGMYNVYWRDTSNSFLCNNEDLWWSTKIDGTPTSPGMNYAYRSKIVFNTSHAQYNVSQVMSANMATGFLNKSPVTDMHYVDGMQTWTYSVVRYKDISHIIYLNKNFQIMGVSYNHISQQWFNTATFITNSGSLSDTHFAPSSVVDSKGYVHVFYGCHHTKINYIRSSADGDIKNWNYSYVLDVPGGNYMTYPSCHVDSKDNVYVFARRSLNAELSDGAYFSLLKKDTSGPTLTAWHSAWKIIYHASAASAGFYKNTPTIYNAGTGIDENDNLHCAVSFITNYAQTNIKSQGLMYCYSTSGGLRWKDLKKQISWNAGGYGLGTNVPGIWNYNTVAAVRFSKASSWEYGGNQNSMTFSAQNATPSSTLKRPFFLYGRAVYGDPNATSPGVSSPSAFRVDNLLAKWTGTTWAHVEISSPTGKHIFSGRWGGGLVFGDNEELFTYYGYGEPTSRPWGGGPAIAMYRSIDYGSSGSLEIITAHNEIGQPLINMKRNFSSRQMEAAMSLGDNMYFLKNIKQFPYINADGEDCRVVWKGQEIDRVADLWNYENTNIQFKLQKIVPLNYASATSGYYYIYYGRNRW